MNRFYMINNFDSKGFYNKAVIQINDDSTKQLYSYETLVSEIDGDTVKVYNVQSATTLRHVKEFLKQNGFKADTKQQIINDYMNK